MPGSNTLDVTLLLLACIPRISHAAALTDKAVCVADSAGSVCTGTMSFSSTCSKRTSSASSAAKPVLISLCTIETIASWKVSSLSRAWSHIVADRVQRGAAMLSWDMQAAKHCMHVLRQ